MTEREMPGQRIRNLREAAFITQKDFAERIGVAPSQLSRIESGETKTISSDILIAIATEFNVSADYLLGLSTLQTPRNVDVTMTGLSEVAFNRMVNGEMDMDVLNRLIEHKHFPQLTKMIRIYFADELEYGIQSRNMILDTLSDTIMEFPTNSEEAEKSKREDVMLFKSQKFAPHEADFERIKNVLSTIVTFCEDGPHDTLYFNDPIPMFRGDPRRPWIDVRSEKLLQRHLAMVILQEFLSEKHMSLDTVSAAFFLKNFLDSFKNYLTSYNVDKANLLLPIGVVFHYSEFADELKEALDTLKEKCHAHPELFGVDEGAKEGDAKIFLDALYEEGIVPTYSFPKNVVSTYIPDMYGKILYEVDRGLDVAIGEYALGRALVVDKQTYQIGGFYYPGSERRHGQSLTPARAYTEDPNYVKQIISCSECGWFGLMEEHTKRCPFCGNGDLKITREMMRPWGFAPRNAEAIPDAQLSEEYTAVQQPLYSTLPDAEEMKLAPGCKNIRIASRTNQRIIMLNKGSNDKGFMVCKDCGAAMPGDDISVLNDVNRPYKSKYARSRCRHSNSFNVNLGYDFITDMLVLEFTIDDKIIDVHRNDNPWLGRAAQSLAEALRLVASKKLDIEFTELVTGYRLRTGAEASYIDIYLYDSLSSGAGYAVSVADIITEILSDMKELLSSCNCGSACSKCLKHYRNQYVHGMLDRFAALQLLEWGIEGIKALPIKSAAQINMIMPLTNILKQSGCKITVDGEIVVNGPRKTKKVAIYPAMWVEPCATNTIFVSDAYIKYAKPYAVQKILDNI